MDVTINRAWPREVPVFKPSAEHAYIPRALLRDENELRDGHERGKRRWLPIDKKPGASKHLLSGQANGNTRNRVEPQETVSELDSERLERVEDEMTHLESELDAFIRDFHIATTTFSAQARSQKQLLQRITKPKPMP